MPVREQRHPFSGIPREAAWPSDYWVSRGMTCLYVLDQARWQINHVTGRNEGSFVGAMPGFTGGWLTTNNVGSQYVLLPHGLPTPISLPVTFVWGAVKLSGTVCWSLLRTDSSQWSGWYSTKAGQLVSTQNTSLDGDVQAGGTGSAAACHSSASSLIAASNTGRAIDTTTTAPTSVTNGNIALGVSLRIVIDNASSSVFTHFACINSALNFDELTMLAENPGLLFEPQRIWVPVSSAGYTHPALSNARGENITSSGFQPAVDYNFA